MCKPSLLVIFLTVFIDLIGFGLVLPMLPIFSKTFGASGLTIGLIVASFSLMQFLFAPLWGRLSDRVGRRPILLISTAGAALSYALFAVGSGCEGRTGLLILLGSRLFAGFCGANIAVAQAYIADITPPADRSKRMGLIGMAFGLGFVLGPVLGGVALRHFGNAGPGWVATALCLFNLILAFFKLGESRQPNTEQAPDRPHWQQWKHTLSQPQIGLLVAVLFLGTFCFACYETVLGLLLSANFHLDIEHNDHAKAVIAYCFAFTGVIGALMQGAVTGRLVRRLQEPRVIALSLVITAFGFGPMPWSCTWPVMLTLLGVAAIGTSLTRPPVFGMISNLTPPAEQGATMGVTQGAASLARIAGPIFAGILFEWHHAVPYLVCSGILLVTGLLTWRLLHTKAERPT